MKICKGRKEAIHRRASPYDQNTYAKVSDSSNQGNINVNSNKLLLYFYQNDQNFKRLIIPVAGGDAGEKFTLTIALGFHSLLESNLATSIKIKIKNT